MPGVKPLRKLLYQFPFRTKPVKADIKLLAEFKVPVREGPLVELTEKVFLLLIGIRILLQFVEVFLMR